ncbi:cytochrome P450 [Myxococcota bacterium]|nr:cytochrome P450 [Myxococcota bacterium]
MTVSDVLGEAGARDAEARKAPPILSGGWPVLGHLLELRRDPIGLFERLRKECGEIGELNFAGKRVVLLTGESAQESFFRGSDEQLDQAAAYPFMTPIFGRGVVFDASPEQRRQAMRNQSLKASMMRHHVESIARETRRMMAGWGDMGEIDALDFFSELTLYTSSACLIGHGFRDELTPEYFRLFHQLERGTDALAYVNPHLPLPSFWARDRGRRRIVALLEDVFERRSKHGGEERELFDILLSLKDSEGNSRYSIDVITGMFISMMFAGHHTTSGSAAWTLIEMLRHPYVMTNVTRELESFSETAEGISLNSLRQVPMLEGAIKEALRLHPPLILLMRHVNWDFHFREWTVSKGKQLAVSPAVSNRLSECFQDPESYDPSRYEAGREEDAQIFAWIPFGAGRHKCVGAQFALIQLKTILMTLLLDYDFELSQPPDRYTNEHSKMVVQLQQPCRLRYVRKSR